MTELKPYVLRYWESEFPSLKPSKNRAGNRTYKKQDIQVILDIKKLLYQKKFTIKGAVEELKNRSNNPVEEKILSSSQISALSVRAYYGSQQSLSFWEAFLFNKYIFFVNFLCENAKY